MAGFDFSVGPARRTFINNRTVGKKQIKLFNERKLFIPGNYQENPDPNTLLQTGQKNLLLENRRCHHVEQQVGRRNQRQPEIDMIQQVGVFFHFSLPQFR
jgi:hypothetical protein